MLSDDSTDVQSFYFLPLTYRTKAGSKRKIIDIGPEFQALTGFSRRDFLAAGLGLGDLVHPDESHQIWTAIEAAVTAGRPYDLVYRLRGKLASDRWVLDRGRFCLEETKPGSPCLEGFLLDITGQIDRFNARLADVKENALATAADRITHDVNNLLTVIVASLELVKMRTGEDPQVQKCVDRSIKAAFNGAELNRKLLRCARLRPLNPRKVNLSRECLSLKPRIQQELGNRLSVQMDLAEELWPTWIDREDFSDAILGLLVTLADSSSLTPIVVIRTLNSDTETIRSGAGKIGCVALDLCCRNAVLPVSRLRHGLAFYFRAKGNEDLGVALFSGFVRRSCLDLHHEVQGSGEHQLRLLFPRVGNVGEAIEESIPLAG